MNDTRIVLIGVGGYGDTYVKALLETRLRDNYVVVGVVDPFVKSAAGYEKLCAAGIAFYDTPEEFFAANKADLAIVATPTVLREKHALCVLENGCNLLLEKPIGPTPEQGRRIAEKAKEKGLFLAIGFQWCYDYAMLDFKRDVDAGLFGKPLDLRSLVIWPRDFAYYNRGIGWAGKNYSKEGEPIFDSIASNATAHYLENMLWICGEGYNGAAVTDMQVETWRANDIETYDTVTLTGTLDCGAKIAYMVTHATPFEKRQDPLFLYRFEKGVARFEAKGAGGNIIFTFNDGSVKNYGFSYNGNQNKPWTVLDALREGGINPCPPETALKHIDAIAMMRNIQPEAHVFKNIQRSDERVWVDGLYEKMFRCFRDRIMLSETGVEKA